MRKDLNIAFRKSLEDAIGEFNAKLAYEAFESPASVSIRINPYKSAQNIIDQSDAYETAQMSHRHILEHMGVSSFERVPWNEYAYMLDSRPSFTLDPLFHAGTYYVQDSSAMFVGHVFRKLLSKKDRVLRVLDLCAAPGGKTTDLAASLRQFCGNDFVLVSNEVMRQRSAILADNVGKWGDPNVVVTSVDPKAFAKLEGFFDIIVADVPCSGEGMFRKDEEALSLWSEDNVALCEARQRRILADVWPSLSEDGIMIYSTCTFNVRENDGNVDWACNNLGAESISLDINMSGVYVTKYGFSLVPGLVKGEGQYCSAIRKIGGISAYVKASKPQKSKNFSSLFTVGMDFVEKNGTEIAIPHTIKAEVDALEFLHPLTKGVAIGVMKGKDLVPHADLALVNCLSEQAFESVELDKQDALLFLHKDPIVLKNAARGLILVKYDNYNLGFVKNLGNRCNNLLPQGRRIRMDI